MTPFQKFVRRFAEAAEDCDYSAYDRLRTLTQFDIEAAGAALWDWRSRRGDDLRNLEVTPHQALEALLAKRNAYQDERELVAVEFEEFWDQASSLDLSTDLLRGIESELTQKFLASRTKDGYTVVNDVDGIWLFKFADDFPE